MHVDRADYEESAFISTSCIVNKNKVFNGMSLAELRVAVIV